MTEISYCHKDQLSTRFVQPASSPIPVWAVDVQPFYREGLSVKDEAAELASLVVQALQFSAASDCDGPDAIATIRTFLAKRDAERDAEVKELVAAAKVGAGYLWGVGPRALCARQISQRIDAALAKLERKS